MTGGANMAKIAAASKSSSRVVGVFARGAVLLAMAAMLAGLNCDGVAAQSASAKTPDKQTIRFVSLRSDRVNVRAGPGKEYKISWIFRRAGLPLEITKQFGNWRQIRDSEGSVGWVHHSLISRRRTALVLPWEAAKSAKGGGKAVTAPIMAAPSDASRVRALVEAGALVGLVSCDSRWCQVSVRDFRGWIEKSRLWGVYPNEVIGH